MSIIVYPTEAKKNNQPQKQSEPLYLQAEGIWLQDGTDYLQHLVEDKSVPQLADYIKKHAVGIEKIGIASETESGLIRIATEEEVWQGLNDLAVLTPRRGRGRFYDRESFETYQNELDALFEAKASVQKQQVLSQMLEELSAQTDELEQGLDLINGEIIQLLVEMNKMKECDGEN